ncbi:hypothetical protein ACFS2C_15220 [Prauserella oleivorans]|uniref:DUF8129 domain-containing protein n=1 Tax=Prauserella oleivorans TaxID=1478153 RepID=A0ABW5WC69_9PSEU
MTDHRGDLPLAGYDRLPVLAVRERIRSLPAEDVRRLLAYEENHADRLAVVTALQARLDQLTLGSPRE